MNQLGSFGRSRSHSVAAGYGRLTDSDSRHHSANGQACNGAAARHIDDYIAHCHIACGHIAHDHNAAKKLMPDRLSHSGLRDCSTTLPLALT